MTQTLNPLLVLILVVEVVITTAIQTVLYCNVVYVYNFSTVGCSKLTVLEYPLALLLLVAPDPLDPPQNPPNSFGIKHTLVYSGEWEIHGI